MLELIYIRLIIHEVLDILFTLAAVFVTADISKHVTHCDNCKELFEINRKLQKRVYYRIC
jgi:hypothetical protein